MFDGGIKSKAYGAGVNMAPLQPLLDLQSSNAKTEHYLNDFGKEVYDDLIVQDIDAWRETLEMGRMISNMRSGKLIIKRDPVFHELILMQPPKKKSNRRGVPVFQFYSSNLMSTWCNSNPDIDPVIEGDDDRADLAIETVKQVHNYYERQIFNELYNEREALSAQDYGTYLTRIGYNETLRRIKMLKPVVENTTHTLYDGYGACVTCGYEGKDAEFEEMQMREVSLEPMCPKCKAVGAIIDPSITIDADIVTRYEEFEVGDLQGDLLHFPAARYNIRKMANESEYFLYEQMMPIRLLKGILGDVEIAETHPSGEQNYGLLILEALATRGGTVEDLGKDRLYGHYNTFKQQCLVTEMWLKPELYADVVIQGDEKTVSGQKLESGKKMIELFPNGVCFIGLNGMDTILAIYGENHSDSIVPGIYHLQSHSGIGKGVSDAVDVYKDLNLMHSKAMAYIERFSTPSYGYIKDTVSEELAAKIGDPTQNIPFDISMMPQQIRSIADLVQPLQSGSPNQSLFTYAQQLNNMLQLAFQATEFSDGLPGVNNNTATGAEITRDNARKQSVPALKLKAEHRKQCAPVIMGKFRQIPAARFFENSDRFGIVKGKYISGEDLPERISWEVVGNSEVPLNEYDERRNLEELGMQTGGLPGLIQLAQMSPRFAGWAAKKYKVDAPIVTEDDIAKVCRTRVDNISQLCKEADELLSIASQILGAEPDTRPIVDEILAKLNRPLGITEAAHAEKAAWLSELLDSDELHEQGRLFRECVQQLAKNHIKMTILQPYEMAKLEQEVQLALMEEQNEAMAPMRQQQMAEQSAMAQEQSGLEQQNAANQAQQQNESMMLQEGIGVAREDRKHAQSMEMAKFQANAAKEQAAVKAKPPAK